MLGLMLSVLSGPERSDMVSGRWTSIVLALPLILLAAASLCAAFAGVSHTIGAGWRVVATSAALAACATLLCAVAGSAAACRAAALPWLLPLWVGVGVGTTGWLLLPLPRTPAATVVEAALLALPVMVPGLAASWRRLPPGLYQTAAACGASPAATFRHVVLALAMPELPRVGLVVFVLAVGWILSME